MTRHGLLFAALAPVVIILGVAASADAQVLTLEAGPVPGQMVAPPAEPAPYVLGHRPPNGNVNATPNVTVVPNVTVMQPAPIAPVVITRPSPPVVVVDLDEYDRPREPEDAFPVEGAFFFGGYANALDLSHLELQMGSPEIAALSGATLSPGWAGTAGLTGVTTGGVGLGFGMRGGGVLRGPELRLFLGGGDIDGAPYAEAPGNAELQLAATSVFVFRAELAVGVQLELFDVLTPYVVGIASVGGAWVDFAVHDDRLGDLGTESADGVIAGLGIEAGVDIECGDGMTVGAAFRGNFVGSPSYGALFTIGFHGE